MIATDCRFCEGERPAADDRVGDLTATVAYLHDDQFFPGWVVLVLKRHATEVFELEPGEQVRMMDDVSRVAAALYDLFAARKINYACLGNQIPHIHWHIVPRLADDPAPLEPVWSVPHAPLRLDPAERAARIARLRQRLDA